MGSEEQKELIMSRRVRHSSKRKKNRIKKIHPPPPPKLSEILQSISADSLEGDSLTINYLLSRTSGQGIFLTVILLTLPFLVPVLPGMSTPFGVAIFYLALRGILGKSGRLPSWVGDRTFCKKRFDKLVSGAFKILKMLEKLAKPRFSWWLMLPGIRLFNWVMIGFLAFLLALPLPVPGTNTIPAYALLLMAAAVMERDGVLVWLGYLLSLCSLIWIVGAVFLGEQLVDYVWQYFQG